MEAWLKGFRSGKRPAWVAELAVPLEGLMAGGAPGATPGEAVAAAVPLVAMGQDAKALPVLQAAAAGGPVNRRAAAASAAVAPVGTAGVAVQAGMLAKAERDELSTHLPELSKIPTPGVADVLWDALASPSADAAIANEVHSSLRQVYLGNRYYDRT